MDHKEYQKIASELDTIYNDFYIKLNALKPKAASIISEIDKKLKDDKVQEVLTKIKNID